MPTAARCSAVSALALAALVPLPAYAAAGPPVGRPCGFEAASWEPVLGADVWAGAAYGGPLLAPGSEVSLSCSIEVNGVAAARAEAGPTQNATVLAPTPVSYLAGAADVVTMCSRATVDTTTWYWDGTAWTTDPDAPCPPAETTEPQTWCMTDLVGCLLDFAVETVNPLLVEVDPTICAVLRTAFPGVPGVVDVRPDGDVDLLGGSFWDCPPYVEGSAR